MSVSLKQLIEVMLLVGGSDLHVATMAIPAIRLNGEMLYLKTPALEPAAVELMAAQIMTLDQKLSFERDRNLNFYIKAPGLGLFQVSLVALETGLSFVMRTQTEVQTGEVAWQKPTASSPSAPAPRSYEASESSEAVTRGAIPLPTPGRILEPESSLLPADFEDSTHVIRRPDSDPWQTGVMKKRTLAGLLKKTG